MNKQHKIIALVGMCGAGKSEVADRFVASGYSYLRFGQITLDEVKRRGLEPKEENERPIREEFRAKHGMAAFAILNIPKIDELLADGDDVLADGLYSWSEYKVLKEKFGSSLIVVAVYAPPETRYARLEDRRSKYKDDPKMKYRSFSRTEAQSRDIAEIEKIEKAGPIAMADYTVVNTGTLDDLDRQVNSIIKQVSV
ncbi:MAG: AAA family ATPase [Patescibacteria group bacterium]|jgi:dephospho-CoA kinase